MADYYFRCQRDYLGPSKSSRWPGRRCRKRPFLTLSGYLHRREGRWEKAKRDFSAQST